jgi:hypothetical protein
MLPMINKAHPKKKIRDNIPLSDLNNIWFQHDGAPAHSSYAVRDFLDDRFPQKWIGRGGTVEWAPRSPDLTPLDFFFWGFLKDSIYDPPPETPDVLKDRIRQASGRLRPNVLRSVRENQNKRFQYCIVAGGNRFEQYF